LISAGQQSIRAIRARTFFMQNALANWAWYAMQSTLMTLALLL